MSTTWKDTCTCGPGVGPRLPGGVYLNGTTGQVYEVVALYHGIEARRLLGDPAATWALEVFDLHENRARLEHTAWNSGQDEVVDDPGR